MAKQRRLEKFDYRTPGAYFVTICARERQMVFEDEAVQEVVVQCWKAIPKHMPNVGIDSFVVMPNHIHGIVIIKDYIAAPTGAVDAMHASRLRPGGHGTKTGSLSAIVQSFKSAVSRELRLLGLLRPDAQLWQRSFYDRVIRNEGELDRIRLYIANNPAQWAFDHENPAAEHDAAYVADWGWLEGNEALTVS